MPTTLAWQVRFSATSNKTEDDIMNTWHFQVETLPPATATLTAIRDELDTFYSAFSGSIPNDWSSVCTMKMYDLADPKPRAPITTYPVTLSAFSSANNLIPREMCPVLSFKGSTLSGVPMARRRGRLYLPPLNAGAYDGTGRFLNSTLGTLKDAANALLTASDAASDWTWVVYSPTTGNSTPVVEGWVDNAPDVQRRRGVDASNRNIFP